MRRAPPLQRDRTLARPDESPASLPGHELEGSLPDHRKGCASRHVRDESASAPDGAVASAVRSPLPRGPDHGLSEVDLGFGQNPPAARAAVADVKRRPEEPTHAHRNRRVGGGRPGRGDKLTIEDLTDQALGQPEEILVARRTSERPSRSTTIARPRGARPAARGSA